MGAIQMGLLDKARTRLAEWIKPESRLTEAARVETTTRESIILGPSGVGPIDNDEHLFRRLTGGDPRGMRRDLTPLGQDRMIEIVNFLWEQNCFAKRLVTLMTDLILGEGITVQAADEKVQGIIDQVWNHRVNQLATRVRAFYNGLSVNGELIIPVAINPISGVPTLGYIDPFQVKTIIPLADNVLVPDIIVLKPGLGQAEGPRLRVVRENPETGRLEGEVFYKAINCLPNSLRGRSDLLPVADWLDLYDQYMFAEVERLNLLSNFVWDYTIEGATTQEEIDKKLRAFPTPKPGTVFGHNEKEKLEARTPDLKAQDRTEVARMMRVHIAGSMGYPVSYLGDVDSNKATIEGQNDIMLKTPSARQKEFVGFIDQILRFGIEQVTGSQPALYREVQHGYTINVPEISAKDITRVGSVVQAVVSGMDTAIANKTVSRKSATQVTVSIMRHLGVDLDPAVIEKEIAAERQADDDQADDAQANQAAGRRRNPPVPGDDEEGADPEADDAAA